MVGLSGQEQIRCWTCYQQAAGSNPGCNTVECNTGQVVHMHGPLISSVQESYAVEQVFDILSLCLHPSLSSAASFSAT